MTAFLVAAASVLAIAAGGAVLAVRAAELERRRKPWIRPRPMPRILPSRD